MTQFRHQTAVCTYETPFPAMAQIKDYVAFHPDRVNEIAHVPSQSGGRGK